MSTARAEFERRGWSFRPGPGARTVIAEHRDGTVFFGCDFEALLRVMRVRLNLLPPRRLNEETRA